MVVVVVVSAGRDDTVDAAPGELLADELQHATPSAQRSTSTPVGARRHHMAVQSASRR